MATPFDIGGLLGSAFGGGLSGLEDLLTPEQLAAIQRQSGLSAAAALLQAAGPSTTRTSLGQALGSAFTAGQAGMQRGTESALQQMLTREKLDEAKRARDLQANIAKILTGGAAPAGGEVTAEEALAVPGMAAGPTAERAALIGQPRAAAAGPQMSAAEQQANVYRRLAGVYAANNRPQDAKIYNEMAESMAPSRPEIVGAPIRTKTGYVQQTKTGQFIPLPKDYEPVSKPTGAPEVRTDSATGRQVLVQGYEDGTFQTVPGFGPKREFKEINLTFLAVGEAAFRGLLLRPVSRLLLPPFLPPLRLLEHRLLWLRLRQLLPLRLRGRRRPRRACSRSSLARVKHSRMKRLCAVNLQRQWILS